MSDLALTFDVEQLAHKPHIRSCEIQGVNYFSLIDVLADLRETDYKTAQNFYHVLKYRMTKNEVTIPTLMQVKAKGADGKSYFTDFAAQTGIAFVVDYLKHNLRNENYRTKVRLDDELVNFHPQVIAFFEEHGWSVSHHVKLAFGSQIDILATLRDEVFRGIFIVECKPRLPCRRFYTAAGQILCYWVEYGKGAVPVIATYSSQIDDYVEACCHSLGIRLLAVDMLKHTTILHDEAVGYDLVTEKPLLPKKKKE